jgi:hypothetical protein
MVPCGAWAADQPSPYEDAARIDVALMASDVLASAACKSAQLNGPDQFIKHFMIAAFIIKDVSEVYLSATKATIDQMEARVVTRGARRHWRRQRRAARRC